MSSRSGRCLIIASWNGLRRHETPDNEALLREHWLRLHNLKHSLDRVLVVQNRSPKLKETPDALELFRNPLVRDNINGSYGAWIDGYRSEPDYEWYFLIEDDYFFEIDHFDDAMIEMWRPGMSYLAAMVAGGRKYPVHAAISNGLTRGDVMDSVDFNFPTIHIYNDLLQVAWSAQFAKVGSLRDVRSRYSCPFYDGPTRRILHHDPEKPILMRPAQFPIVKDALQV